MRVSVSTLLFLLPLAAYALISRRRRSARTRKLKPYEEHVLVLGASSGVGRAIAVRYASRGARVCLVSRGGSGLEKALDEARRAANASSALISGTDTGNRVICFEADFSLAEDMVGVREYLSNAGWKRLDTLIVAAGVSALRPVLEIAGIQHEPGKAVPDADLSRIQESVRISNAAIQGNFTGPYTAAVTFIPLMSRTSPSPSILLISSLAALAPAPTRGLYGATKSASLLLYQSLAIEHPDITFTCIIPSTIEGDFRKSAVDAGPVRELNPNKHGLKRDWVAQRCIDAVDAQERTVFMANFYRFIPMLVYTIDSWGRRIVERGARKKYNFGM